MKLVNMILFCKNRPLDLFSRFGSYYSFPTQVSHPLTSLLLASRYLRSPWPTLVKSDLLLGFRGPLPFIWAPYPQTSSLCAYHQHRSPSHEIRSPWRTFVKIESGYRGRIRIQIPIPVSHSPASPLHALHRHMTDHETRSPVGPQLDFTVSPFHCWQSADGLDSWPSICRKSSFRNSSILFSA